MHIQMKKTIADMVAEALIGQCIKDIEQALEDVKHPEILDDKEFLQLLDDRAFCCDGCGWWCSTDELNVDEDFGDQFCDDCYTED
jgi:hypothetical protein